MADAAARLLDEAMALGLAVERLALRRQGEVSGRIAALRAELAALVARHDFTEVVRRDARRRRLEELVAAAAALTAMRMAEASAWSDDDLAETAGLAHDSLSAALAAILLLSRLSRPVPADELRAMATTGTLIEGATPASWWDAQAADLSRRFANAMADAEMRGQELGEVLARVRGARAFGWRDGLLGTTERHARGLVASAAHAVAGTARETVMRRHPEYIKSFLHLSILDNRTSDICRNRAYRLWDMDGRPLGHNLPYGRPPLHWLCRSHLVPVMLAYDDLPDSVRRRADPGDFTGKPPPETGRAAWERANPRHARTSPIGIDTARALLGLPPRPG